MALKGKWTDKTDGIDIASAEDINRVAHAVIELEDGVENVSGVYVGSGEMPEGYNVQVDPNGDASVVAVGDVVTLEEGEDAYVTSKNEDGQVVLSFGIPRGEKGESADKKPWTLIDDHTVVEKTTQYEKETDGEYTEVFIEAVLKIYTEETSASVAIRDGVGKEFVAISANVPAVSNGTVIYHRANGIITPSGKYMFDTAASKSKNTSTVSRNCSDPNGHDGLEPFTKFDKLRVLTNSSTKYQLDAGSTIKIWGR